MAILSLNYDHFLFMSLYNEEYYSTLANTVVNHRDQLVFLQMLLVLRLFRTGDR